MPTNELPQDPNFENRDFVGFSRVLPGDVSGSGLPGIKKYNPMPMVPLSDTSTDAVTQQQVQTQEDVSNKDRSFWTAVSSSWRQNTLAGRIKEFMDKPLFEADPKYSPQDRAQALYQSGVQINEGREYAAAHTVSAQDMAWHIQNWKTQDAAAAAMEEHPVGSMGAALADVDILLALGSAGASTGLKTLGVGARMFGAAGLEERLAKAATVASRTGEISLGSVYESRLANAMVGAGYGTAWTLGVSTLSDEPMKMQDYFRNAVMFGVAGSLFRRSPTNPLIHEPEPALAAAHLDMAQSRELMAREGANTPGGLTAQEIAKMTDEQFVEHQIQHTAGQWSQAQKFDLRTVFPEDTLKNFKPGAVIHVLDRTVQDFARSTVEADLKAMSPGLAAAFHKVYGDSTLVVRAFEGEAGQVAGGMAWLNHNTAMISLSTDALVDAARHPSTAIHELGHAIVIRELGQAMERGNKDLVDMFRREYLAEMQKPLNREAMGVLDPGQVVGRGLKADITPEMGMLSLHGMGRGGAEGKVYWRNFNEWSAQQFVKTAYKVVAEAGGAAGGDLVARATSSALFKALPEGVRTVLGSVLEKFKTLYNTLFKSKALDPSTDMESFFKQVFERTPEQVNPHDLERTVVDAPEPRADLPTNHTEPPPASSAAGSGGTVTPTELQPPVVPYGPTALNSVNPEKWLRWSEKVFGPGWYSIFDNLNSRGGYVSGLAQMLVVDGAGRTAQSAAAFKRTAELELSASRASFDNALMQSTGMSKFEQLFHRSTYVKAMHDTELAVYQDLLQKYRAHGKGEALPVNPDPKIEALSQAYAKSGFAQKSLNYMKLAGRYGADLVEENPWYVPMRTSADAVTRITLTGKGTRADVQALLTAQVRNIFTDMSEKQAQQVGKNLLDGIMERGRGVNSKMQHFEGTTVDELRHALEGGGFSAPEVDAFLARYEQRATSVGRDRQLRHRLDWDFSIKTPTQSGGELSMLDIVDGNLLHSLEGYQRAVSGQYGLGMVGFKSDAQLKNAIKTAVEEYQSRVPNTASVKYTEELLNNVVDSLVGRRVGEAVPELFRGLSSLSSSVVLKNPAVYMAGEAASVAHKIGITRLVGALMQDGLLSGMKVAEHSELRDFTKILQNRYTAEGRWRPLVTHMEDNFDMIGPAAEWMQAIGQGTRFANGMEFVRRKLCSAVSNVIVSDMYKAARGDARAVKFLERYGFDETLRRDMAKELDKHGENPLLWGEHVLARTEAAAMNTMDQLIQANRLGELPAFMQYSTTGKLVMPYMNFVGAAFNKVLRKNLIDEGASGAAMMMLYSATGGIVGEMGRNILAGRAPNDSGSQNFLARAISTAPMSSWFGYGLDTLNSVGGSGGLVQFAYPAAVKRAATDPSVKNVVAAIPLAQVVPGVGILTSAISE